MVDIKTKLKQADDYIKSCIAQGEQYALAASEAFWLSMTSVFFRSFGYAMAELIDNSVEAGAALISFYISKNDKDKKFY